MQDHVTIPDGVTYLGKEAFSNTNISTVFLPNSVTKLSHGLFQGYKNLKDVFRSPKQPKLFRNNQT